MPNHWSIADIDNDITELEKLTKELMDMPILPVEESLSKREMFASMVNVDVDGYSQMYAEQVLGEDCPNLDDIKGHLIFWAKFKSYVKVLEADLLIEALNKQP